MKREIKFRGKSLNTNRWVYGDLRQDKIRRKAYVEYEVDPETVGQYTGLKDKNGKEIFEGDIIFIGGGSLKAAVIWFNSAFRFRDELNSKVIYFEDIDVIVRDYGVQVIGNVIDNPELMK